jgi:hypothetical protein
MRLAPALLCEEDGALSAEPHALVDRRLCRGRDTGSAITGSQWHNTADSDPTALLVTCQWQWTLLRVPGPEFESLLSIRAPALERARPARGLAVTEDCHLANSPGPRLGATSRIGPES